MRLKLKEARQSAKMTQQQVADALHVSLRYYKMIEAGTVVGAVELWDAMEDMFSVHQRTLRENHHGQADSQ